MRLPAGYELARYVRPVVKYASWVLVVYVMSWVFLQLNRRFFFNGIGYDEGFFVWGGWSINKGLAPYKEFLEFKPPFVFLTHALAIKLFGIEMQRYRIFFQWVPLAACVSFTVALMQRGVSRLLSLSTGLIVVMLFTIPKIHDTALSDSESIGLTYYLFGAACLLLKLESPKLRAAAQVAGGIFFAMCALSKEPFSPCVVATWIGCFLLNHKGELRKMALSYAKFTIAGVLVVVVGLCIYMIPTGSMRAYLDMATSYARLYRDPKVSYCVVLGKIKLPDTQWKLLLMQWEEARREFLNDGQLGYLAPLFAAGAFATLRRSFALLITGGLALAGSIWAVTASNCQWHHYYTMTIAGIVFCLALTCDSITHAILDAKAKGHGVRLTLGVAILAGIAMTLLPRLEFERKQEYAYPPRWEPVPGIYKFIAENTVPSDRIFTTGQPIVYVHANRIAAVRESNFVDEILGVYPPGPDEQMLAPIRAELERNMPKIVILDPEHGHRKGRHHKALIMPFLEAHQYQQTKLPYVYIRP
jgi:hypothetical protein